MAARRLIIAMLVLLGLSTAIAFVVPEPKSDPSSDEPPVTGASGTTGATGGKSDPKPPDGSSDPVEAEITPSGKPQTVKARPGERLVLTIDPGRNADVEVPGLGLAGTATEYAPVVFDVMLPTEPGTFRVVETGKGELAMIETGKAG